LAFPSKEELENIIMDKYIVGVELNTSNYDLIKK